MLLRSQDQVFFDQYLRPLMIYAQLSLHCPPVASAILYSFEIGFITGSESYD